jgi:HEAT repeat protein
MRSSGRLNREDAASLCLQIGSQIVGPLLDELVEEDAKSVRRFLIGLIVSFKEDAAKEAAARLEDPIWFVTRNMLFILNVCGGKEVLDLGRQYLNHDHLRVRAEALKIQLDHQDPGGPSRILEYIGSEKDEDKVLGLELAGRYRIREAVPLLIAGLQRRSVTGKDLEGKIGLIRVLGEIGDPRALNAISEVLKEKSFLFKGLVENMKKEVFRSLKYYPYDAVEELVKRGARSKNPQIRKESLKLMKQKGKNR